ncbi:hypothetical protein K8I28_02990 [bacterium]|nr:hypothetical protein [bacterium]
MKLNALDRMLNEDDKGGLQELLLNKPATTFKLIRKLYSTNDNIRGRAVQAFSFVAEQFDDAKLKDIVQRLMWLLNEESGNYCPHAARALVEIARIKPESVRDHLPQLEYYANCESEALRRESSYAVREIKNILGVSSS